MLFLLIIVSIIEIILFINIYNNDKLFGFFYLVLFIYILAPAAARIYNNDYVNTISRVNINENTYILQYILYCFLFMVMMYIAFLMLLKNQKRNGKHIKLVFIKVSATLGTIVYNLIQLTIIFYLWFKLLKNIGQMSYYNQSVVKSNIIWYLLLEFVFVFVMIDIFYFIDKKHTIFSRCVILFQGVLILMALMITCINIGNRGIFLPPILGILYLVLEKYDIRINFKSLKKWIKPIIVVIVIVSLSQLVRINRGSFSSAYSLSAKEIFSFFGLDSIMFQDYTYPGNSLIYCIANDLIEPLTVIKSNIGNGIFFLNYDSIAGYLSSNYIAVGEWFGIGGFLPVEAYLFAGILGIFVLPFLVVLFYRIYYNLMLRVNDKRFILFCEFLIATFLTLNLVRGQTYLLFKVLYMYFLPSILLYRLQFGYCDKEKLDNNKIHVNNFFLRGN